jgi:hypothetical protein
VQGGTLKIGIQERESVVMIAYAIQVGPKKHFFHPQWSLISTNKISKFTHLTIMCLCGCFFKQSWEDLWTQPEIVGVDFRTRMEIGTPTLFICILDLRTIVPRLLDPLNGLHDWEEALSLFYLSTLTKSNTLVQIHPIKLNQLNDCISRWLKEPQWENDCGWFS